MIRSLVLPIAFVALAASCAPLLAQSAADDAAQAAQLVAARADQAFERIDPDLGVDGDGAPLIDATTPEEPAMAHDSLPSRAGDDEATFAAPTPTPAPAPEIAAPRGPAVRMIPAEPVVATSPSPAPAPVALASNDPFVIKSILPIEGTLRYGDWFWDESAAPRSGKLVITVDLEARVISAFRDGHEIGTAVALLGTREHPTPLGTFPILTKERDNVSEKYNNAPMPFTLRLTWDGIAIHGSPVMNGYASHGCIGVPDEFAARLFAAAGRGDKVIITRGRMIGVGDKVL
ncbi:MAG: L,D-transpeptidase family protein [Erythrobacter sp.]